MHDFELGDWRSLFIHLLRILDSVDGNLLVELDRRYVISPAFNEPNVTCNIFAAIGKCLLLAEILFGSSLRIPQK